MMKLKIFLGEDKIFSDVRTAKGPFTRLKGLMFDKMMTDMDGLLIPGCNWIHTFFMRFPIDVVYLNRKYEVVDIDVNVVPWRMCVPRFKAKHVLELRGGSLEGKRLSIGEVLKCIA
jgi:uncharacterized protein